MLEKIDKKYSQYFYHAKLAQIPQLLLKRNVSSIKMKTKKICPCLKKKKITSTKTQLDFYFVVNASPFYVGYTHLILIEEIKKRKYLSRLIFILKYKSLQNTCGLIKNDSVAFISLRLFLLNTSEDLISFCKNLQVTDIIA